MALLLLAYRICAVVFLLSNVIGGVSISFPVLVSRNSASNKGIQGQSRFTLSEGQNPVKALRKYCGDGKLEDVCASIRDYMVQVLARNDSTTLDSALDSHDDDTILVSSFQGAWANALHIDLSQLGGSQQCTSWYLSPFLTLADDVVRLFCSDHNLKGIFCRELNSDVQNYLNSLHRSEVITLRNLLEGMDFQGHIEQIMFFVDVLQKNEVVTRKFFAPVSYNLLDEALKFCVDNQLSRRGCSAFVEYLQSYVDDFYSHAEGQLWPFLYISRALEAIVTAKSTSSTDENINGDDYVDADFIEIGTSNFNTLTQLVDDSDGLVGFAVEPSAHYLLSLPDKTGVTKVNCAIMSADDARDGVSTVDLYYIPEETIREKQLGDFMMGCNSIGAYHTMQVALGYQEHVQIEKVQAQSIESFLTEHRIRKIRLLKIDAEGYDVVIMEELYQYLLAQHDTLLYPERIVFESNNADQFHIVNDLIVRFVGLGYVLVMNNNDTILERLAQ